MSPFVSLFNVICACGLCSPRPRSERDTWAFVCNCTQSHQQAAKVALTSVNYLSGVITCLLGGFVVTCTEHCTTPGLLSEAHNSIPNYPYTSLPFFFQLCLPVPVHLNLRVVFRNNCPSFLITGERESSQGMFYIYIYNI